MNSIRDHSDLLNIRICSIWHSRLVLVTECTYSNLKLLENYISRAGTVVMFTFMDLFVYEKKNIYIWSCKEPVGPMKLILN